MISTFSTISTDLSHAETILQIADSLDHLDLITNQLFNGLLQKIDKNFQQLDDIDRRIKIAGEKVNAVQQRKQRSATCLYASAKFPASDYSDYQSSLVGLHSQTKRKPHNLSKKSRGLICVGPDRGLDQREIKEKLQFYNFKSKSKSSSSLLETLPPKSPSVALWSSSSFLLFNTAENPFGNLTYIDPFDARSKKSKHSNQEINSDEKKGLQEAPSSLSNARGSEDFFNENFYIPDLGDLPDFELPDILPDLPGIAQNLNFGNIDLNFGNDLPENRAAPPPVPSAFLPAPGPSDQLPIIPSGQPEVVHPSAVVLPPPPIEPPISLPLPVFEPCPDLPTLPTDVHSNTQLSAESVPMASNINKPSSEKFDAPDGAKNVQQLLPQGAAQDETRASLLQAIRNAGGSGKAGLKSVQEQKAEEKRSKNVGQTSGKGSSGGGDLMSDLASKLAMRRKGISGSQRVDTPASGAGSRPTGGFDAMAKISSLIPPPKTSAANESSGSEDDWN